MTLLAPRYRCDGCSAEAVARWTGQPHWDLPDDWQERVVIERDAAGQELRDHEFHLCPPCRAAAFTDDELLHLLPEDRLRVPRTETERLRRERHQAELEHQAMVERVQAERARCEHRRMAYSGNQDECLDCRETFNRPEER